MKIALAQINYHIGNFERNLQKILEAIQQAKEQKVDLVVFAELAISGYPPRDFLEFDDFIEKCNNAIESIASECHDIAVIIGAPSRNPDRKGKSLFNSAFFLSEGKLLKVHPQEFLNWTKNTILNRVTRYLKNNAHIHEYFISDGC